MLNRLEGGMGRKGGQKNNERRKGKGGCTCWQSERRACTGCRRWDRRGMGGGGDRGSLGSETRCAHNVGEIWRLGFRSLYRWEMKNGDRGTWEGML